ncbi:ABC transporter substrate-binding protein [Prosthecobacter sp.]|uniref:ABC transporter substrate-binding protein n=1 Tax=Prosthecobacter sp. TaxID=1965333 RepID=UPI0037833BEB
MKKSKALLQRFLPLLGAALLLAASFFPYREQKTRLRIAPGVWPPAEALLVASDLQILPPSRFQTIEMPWSSAVVRAFGSGAADVAVVTLDSLLRMREAGQKLKVLMVLSRSTGGDAVLARPGIQRLEDLKGKRVAVERSAGSYLLASALESAGMRMEDVESVPMFQSEMETAMQGGQVDAAVATEPWLTILSRQGAAHSVYDSSQLKVPILYLLVASEQACASSRQDLVSLLKVQEEMAGKIWAGRPFPGMDAVLRRENLKETELPACLVRLHHLDKAENERVLKELPELALQMEDLMIRGGMLKTKRTDSGWIDESFAKEVPR